MSTTEREIGASKRLWRIDGTARSNAGDDTAALDLDTQSGEKRADWDSALMTRRSKAIRVLRHWGGTCGAWLSARAAWLEGDCRRFEDILHRFAAWLDTAAHPAEIQSELVSVVGLFWPASRSEFVPSAGPAQSCQDHRRMHDGEAGDANAGGNRAVSIASRWVEEVPVKWGAAQFGCLRIVGFGTNRPAHRSQRARRLKTLCALAACALESLNAGQERRGAGGSTGARQNLPDDPRRIGAADSDCGTDHLNLSMVHDATFLNAVLPFAIAQAHRHRESLSLVCVAIDRLHAVRALLGTAAADGLVRFVGDSVVSLVRKSDIVARLDDDRIVAVLPRAADEDALRIGQTICERVGERGWMISDEPGMKITVCTGAATFPSSASNVLSLFDAADAALAQAQAQGRNQSVTAPRISEDSGRKGLGAADGS